MSTDNTVAEIASRFGSERLEIVQYVNFMHDQCAIPAHEIVELNALLSRHRLPELPTRDHLAINHYLSPAEIVELTGAIDRTEPAIDRIVGELSRHIHDIPLLPDSATERPDLLGEWIEYVVAHLPDDPRAKEYPDFEEALLADVTDRSDLEDDLSSTERRLIVNEALRCARHIKLLKIANALQYTLDRFKTIKAVGRLVEPNAVVGIFRQGFILLMTAFDAAVFDLVRAKLRKDFFSLIGVFGKGDKVTLQELGEAGSFDTFRESIIEGQLKIRYIKDLLFFLENLGVKCTDQSNGQRFIQLIELVLRRNVHIHNRGVVDERYLERDAKGQPKYNLYNFRLGDTAQIDERYWQLANRLCCACIRQVAGWAAG